MSSLGCSGRAMGGNGLLFRSERRQRFDKQPFEFVDGVDGAGDVGLAFERRCRLCHAPGAHLQSSTFACVRQAPDLVGVNCGAQGVYTGTTIAGKQAHQICERIFARTGNTQAERAQSRDGVDVEKRARRWGRDHGRTTKVAERPRRKNGRAASGRKTCCKKPVQNMRENLAFPKNMS